MTKKEWREKIVKACEDAQTYKPFFDLVIEQLAEILEMKDKAVEELVATGGSPVITTDNEKYKTVKKNPAFVVINDCNQQALGYWRDLGLTTRGWVALTGNKLAEENDKTFEEVLQGIGL